MTISQAFSCEWREIYQNSFFKEYLCVAASEYHYSNFRSNKHNEVDKVKRFDIKCFDSF